MSASPGDPQPVFDLIVRTRARAVRRATARPCSNSMASWSICGVDGGHRRRPDDREAYRSDVPDGADARVASPAARSWTGRSFTSATCDAEPGSVPAVRDARRTSRMLSMPLMRDGAAIGAIALASRRARRLLRQPDRTAANLRRAGGDRDHQRRDVSRVADPHERSSGNAGIPDRDQRRAEGHQPLDLRSATGAGHGGRDRRAAVRCRTGRDLPPRG